MKLHNPRTSRIMDNSTNSLLNPMSESTTVNEISLIKNNSLKNHSYGMIRNHNIDYTQVQNHQRFNFEPPPLYLPKI